MDIGKPLRVIRVEPLELEVEPIDEAGAEQSHPPGPADDSAQPAITVNVESLPLATTRGAPTGSP